MDPWLLDIPPVKLSEVSYDEVLVDEGAKGIRVNLHCGHLIIL
jgi:hypothetical protein